MGFLFTSESVSEGHPDKVSDQISDAILDEFLRRDANSKVACETLCTTGLVVVAGEVRSEAYVDVQGVARRVINRIGYTRSDYQFDGNSCGILSAIHEQSSDINQGVVREAEEEQGAGDQGIMFGYACNETREMMPATLILSHVILKELAVIRREGEAMTYLRPDSKSQVTIEYDEQTNKPLRVHTIVVSTQHDEFILPGNGLTEKEAEERMQERIREDVRTILIPRVKARLERAGDKLAGLIGVIGTFGEAMLLHLFYQRTGSLELILKIPYEYNHIFPFLASVGLFCLFLDSDIRGKIGSVAVKIAPYTLGVYLLHENLGVRYAWQKWLGSDRIDGAVSLLLWTVIAVIVVFVLGILVDVIRKNICGGLHKIFLHIRPYRVLTEKIQAVDNMFKREVS